MPVSQCFHKQFKFSRFSALVNRTEIHKNYYTYMYRLPYVRTYTSARARLASYQQINVITRHVAQQEKKKQLITYYY